jgi:hypothetical protein
MNINSPNMMQMWHMAGGAFAERAPSLDPTPEEGYEEFKRAKTFRNNALVVGVVLGLATFTLFSQRRSRK